MTTTTDITALKTRCTAIEAVNNTQATQIAALQAVKPFDSSALQAEITALTARVTALETPPAPAAPAITSLSSGSASVGASLTITGVGFGSTPGTVSFGEPVNRLGWAPCAKTAVVQSWSPTSVTVTVPAMSPGLPASRDPNRYTAHPVYVSIGGKTTAPTDFFITPATVISGQTISVVSGGNVLPTRHDVLYDGCTFTAPDPAIPGNTSGVLGIAKGVTYDLTLFGCAFTGNTGAGSGSGNYGVNGLKVVNGWGNVLNDFCVAACTFGAMSRMSIEVVSDGATAYANYAIRGCTFEPPFSQCISFGSTGAVYALIEDCTLKGFGADALGSWPNAFEANQATHIEVRDCQVWAGVGGVLNLNESAAAPCDLIFIRVSADQTHAYQSRQANGYGELFNSSSGFCGAVFDACSFNLGSTAANCLYTGGGDWTSGYAGNDLSTSTITGRIHRIDAAPASAAGYWSAPGSSTLLPRKA